MKKAISIILSISLVIAVFIPCFSFIQMKIEQNNVVAVCEKVTAMSEEYNKEYEEKLDSAEATSLSVDNRLIVETKSKINTYDAVDEVYGLGYAFIQFDNEEDAEKAAAQYEKQGLTVQNDNLYTVSASSSSTESDWAYKYSEADTTLKYFKNTDNPQIIVGIIDTGIYYGHTKMKDRIIRTYKNFSTSHIGDVFDSSARTLVFVADGSRSFSNTVQLEARWQPLRGLDLDVAWRLNDARQTTAGRLRSTPLQSRYKALLAASAARPHRHHHLPHRQDHRRGALPGRQQAGLRVDHSQPHRHARQGRRLSRRARQATPLAATRRTAPSPCPALPPPPLTDCSTAATAAAKGTRRLHFPLKSVD